MIAPAGLVPAGVFCGVGDCSVYDKQSGKEYES